MFGSSVILRNVFWIDHSLDFARLKNRFAHSLAMAFQQAMNVYNAQHGQPQSTVPVSAHGSIGTHGVTDSQPQQAQAQLQSNAQAQLQQSPYTQMVQTHRGLVHVPGPIVRSSSAQRQAVNVVHKTNAFVMILKLFYNTAPVNIKVLFSK